MLIDLLESSKAFGLCPMGIKAATLIFISGRCSTISSAKEGKSGSIYNLVNN